MIGHIIYLADCILRGVNNSRNMHTIFFREPFFDFLMIFNFSEKYFCFLLSDLLELFVTFYSKFRIFNFFVYDLFVNLLAKK